MDKISINNRVLESIEYVLKTNESVNKTVLAKELGISTSKFSEILSGRMKAGPDMMAALSAKYNVSTDYLLTGTGDIIKSDNSQVEVVNRGIPLIPLEAFAGYSSVQYNDIPIEEFYNIVEFNESDFLIRVKGDSMSPKYHGGDIIACKLIRETLFFQWHRIYVIGTRSQGVMVKRVEESKQDGYIRLVSENKDYAPFEIPKSDISDIALVLGAITLE
ncbi:MAG: XRE family transcriptional regulator [Candidatus Egerieousia sp.]